MFCMRGTGTSSLLPGSPSIWVMISFDFNSLKWIPIRISTCTAALLWMRLVCKTEQNGVTFDSSLQILLALQSGIKCSVPSIVWKKIYLMINRGKLFISRIFSAAFSWWSIFVVLSAMVLLFTILCTCIVYYWGFCHHYLFLICTSLPRCTMGARRWWVKRLWCRQHFISFSLMDNLSWSPLSEKGSYVQWYQDI